MLSRVARALTTGGVVLCETAYLCFTYIAYIFGRPATRILILAALVWCAFGLMPQLDLTVSGWFAGKAGGFPLTGNPMLLQLREASFLLTALICAAALGALALAFFFGPARWPIMRPCQAFFLVAVYITGPLLIVNLILKDYYGRARPRQILEFGGDAHFTPVWQIANQCIRNCSFTSGEAATAAAMLSLVFIVPRRRRLMAFVLIAPLAMLFSISRIMFGGHFLSDVLMSWLIMGFLMLVSARIMLAENRMDWIDRLFARYICWIRSLVQRLWARRILTANTENTPAKT